MQLSIDDEVPVRAASSPGSSQLDTDGRLWIGRKGMQGMGMQGKGMQCIEYLTMTGCFKFQII